VRDILTQRGRGSMGITRLGAQPAGAKGTMMKRTVTAAIAGVALTGMVGIGVAAAATGDGPGARLADVLSGLVSEGTISQEQADAVSRALEDAREEARADHEAHRAEREAEVDALLQETLGLTRDELHERLAAGETLKEVAGDKADELAAGAVDLVEEETGQAVSDGQLTQERADAIVARAKERAAAWLAGEDTGRGAGLGLLLGGGMGRGMGPDGAGARGGRGEGPGGWGHHRGGPGGWGADDSASDESSTPTTGA
jgi:polyhydroxyalkanoate synthesis regulator phasin